MKVLKSTLVRRACYVVLSLAISGLSIVGHASAQADCQTLIAELRAQTQAVAITGRNAEKNRAGLLAKLDNASAELGKGKLCDAIGKLNDFRNKVNQLIASGSINTDTSAGVTGQDLVDGATEAIACIQALVDQSGITCPPLE